MTTYRVVLQLFSFYNEVLFKPYLLFCQSAEINSNIISQSENELFVITHLAMGAQYFYSSANR